MGNKTRVGRMTTVSAVICTKDRVREPIECIKSIIGQSVSVTEIIVVDASNSDRLYSRLKKEFPRITYIRSARSNLSKDRNKAISRSSGDIILFLDDDTVLDKDYAKRIIEVFETDRESRIGGVTGKIVNIEKPTTIPQKIRANLYQAVRRIFLLQSLGNGRFKPSGFQTFIDDAHEVRPVESLSGCNMAFRKEVLIQFTFDEADYMGGWMDDVDIAYRVSRKYQNIYTPYAKIIHNLATTGSASSRLTPAYRRAKKTMVSRYYLFKKNFPQTTKNILAFWWSVVGTLLQALMTRQPAYIKGVIDGVRATRYVRIP
ncbi:MAG TPA: glycosyltransferase [Candidatus Bathyarchaeia archaeon]|nr:glycosyltransferase [Candidatus Bathyarchaeia archaeon]